MALAYSPHFELRSFESLPSGKRCRLVLQLARCLVEIDREWLSSHLDTPDLYASGVVYRTQGTVGPYVTGVDHWCDIPTCIAYREGSCEDLAAWRVSELQLRYGETKARPFIRSIERAGMTIYHVVVIRDAANLRGPVVPLFQLPSGEVAEDPSKLLGMVGDA
jgi:hypothetical protein